AKEREKREIESNSRRHLANVRVVQKNLVYVIGLPANLSTEETLRSHDYFGQFGRINKIVVNRRQTGSSSHHPTVGVYVTYATKEDATRAINAVDGSMLEGRVLRATFGTTKYCSYYLRNIPCQNPGCMYLHEPGEEADSFTKEDLAANRVGLRDNNDDDYDDDDDHHHHHSGHQHQHQHHHHNHNQRPSNRASNNSPGMNLASGRVQVVPASSISGFQNGRSHTVAPSSAASSSATSHHHHAAPASVSRVRKSSEINGARPRSVEPLNSDHDLHSTGSALPATASWASRAMAKKPTAEPADSKTRKTDSVGSGTMTLRMIPSSRGKSATVVPVARAANSTSASAAAAGVASGAASGTSRDRSKSSVALDTAANISVGTNNDTFTGTGTGTGPGSGSGSGSSTSASQSQKQQQQHPVLQQMSRERKQQLRHQTRTQQKAADSNESSGGTAGEAKTESASKQQNKKTTSAPQSQSEQNSKEALVSSLDHDSQPEAAAASEAVGGPSVAAEDNDEATQNADDSHNVPADDAQQQSKNNSDSKKQASTLSKPDNALSGDSCATGATVAGTEAKLQAVDYPSVSHANSAISFQNITDSLFAQLNAKVSTPANTAVPSLAASGATFDGHPPGLRPTAGYPVSGVDPLLFPPSIGADTTMTGAYGPVSGEPLASNSPFSLFGGSHIQQQQQQQHSGIAASGQWPGLAAAATAASHLSQSSLSAFLGESASATASLNGAISRDATSSSLGGAGLASRQRSRWDFVQPDEASAQAELQSVLGRSSMVNPSSILGLGSQQHYAPGVPALNSSRDLGLFATPIQNDYALGGGPWGSGSGLGSENANTAPFPPPGFGSRKNTDTSLQTESRSRSPLGLGATPIGSALGSSAGPNTLLSRLIGQSTSEMSGINAAISGGNGSQPSSLSPSALSQQHQFQDPAILSSYMAAAVASMSPQQQAQQLSSLQGQGGRGRTDPNVLNSLLARLHLGQADSESPLSSISTPQGSTLSNQVVGSRAGTILGTLQAQSQPQQQQQSGPMMPPGIIPMSTSASATSPVYGAGGGGVGMHMNMEALGTDVSDKHNATSMNSELLTDRNRQQFQQLKQQHDLQKLQYLQQLQLQQQQQQQQESALLSTMAPRMLQGSLSSQSLDAVTGTSSAGGGGGFVDPAIMNMGRMNVAPNAMGSGVPLSLVGPPPGIQSPQMMTMGGETAGSSSGQAMQSKMPSRSANSSGRSRFLNHFSAEAAPGSSNDNRNPEDVKRADSNSDEHEAGTGSESGGGRGGMVNGVPPGLPTTGLFGELLRRSKLDAAASSGISAIGSPMTLPVADGEASSRVASGRMMLSDIERKLDAARREAQELQAQLSTVIGQNQSAMWALANGGSVGGSPSAGGDAAAPHAGISYSAGNV
ncbi:transcriptional repressor general negative regulator of transcription subunit 4, partial [Coemansia erecta]